MYTMKAKSYYCTKKRINIYIDILLKSMTREQLKSMLVDAIDDLNNFPIENKNQIRFFTQVLNYIIKTDTITIGLKANSCFLYNLMSGNTLSQITGGIMHRIIMTVNKTQFEHFKSIVENLGYDVNQSLVSSASPNYNYSCYLKR